MTSIKPEDRPKLIGLVAGIVFVGCYFIFFVAPRLARAQPAPATEPSPAALSQVSAPVATPAQSAVGVPAGAAVAPASGQSAPAQPAVAQGTAIATTDESKAPSNTVHDPFTPPSGETSRLPAGPLLAVPIGPPTPPVVSSKGVQAVPRPVETMPIPTMTLLGVADGDSAVAVFSVGSGTVEKQSGDLVAGGFRLKYVDGTGVVLAKNGVRIRLDVGQSTQTETPQAPPTTQPTPIKTAQ